MFVEEKAKDDDDTMVCYETCDLKLKGFPRKLLIIGKTGTGIAF